MNQTSVRLEILLPAEAVAARVEALAARIAPALAEAQEEHKLAGVHA